MNDPTRSIARNDLGLSLLLGSLNRAAEASDGLGAAGGIVGGTAPAHVVARRRAANKVARASRRANRRSAR